MGHILHDWDLEKKRMLIGKAYAAIPAGGSFVVYESIIDDDRRANAIGLMMSLNMLIETPGGFDYTGADCQRWMREAGFRDDPRRAPRRTGVDGGRREVAESRAQDAGSAAHAQISFLHAGGTWAKVTIDPFAAPRVCGIILS